MNRTDLRLAVLANGYTPLPNVDKMCQFTGWPTVEVTEAEIRRWERMRGYEATGLRLQDGLMAMDFDIDHVRAGDLYQHLEEAYPILREALVRGGKGHKEAWFLRTSEPFSRIAGPLFDDGGGEGLRVEVFGGASPRQFGAFGWHTKGEREYAWLDDVSPLTVPLSELPELSKQEVLDIVHATTTWLEAQGFEILTREGEGETDPDHVWDLDEGMTFVTREQGELTLEQLRAAAGGAGYFYCSASFADGPVARNTRRCSVSVDHAGGVTIWDSMTDITHHEAALAPREDVDDAEASDVAAALEGLGLPVVGQVVEHHAPPGFGDMQIEGGRANAYIVNNLHNTSIVAREARWDGAIGYNEFLMDYVLLRPVEGVHTEVGKVISPHAWSMITAAVQGTGFGYRKLKEKEIRKAMMVRARHYAFNPLQDYLNGLHWDGTERIGTLPEALFGGWEGSEFEREAFRRWMISAVARAMQPGCQADHVLILSGEGGNAKSNLWRALGGPWHTETMPALKENDRAARQIRNYWIVDLQELSSIKGRESEHTKAFLSTNIDSVYVLYEGVFEESPRHCAFCGSTNDEVFLTDATGNRRYWPVVVPYGTLIDADWARAHRDQLWAEAVVQYRAGQRWWISQSEEPDLWRAAEEAQDLVFDHDPDTGVVMHYVRDKEQVTTREIYEHVFTPANSAARKGKIPRATVYLIRDIMVKQGWSQRKVIRGTRYWTRTRRADPQVVTEVIEGGLAGGAQRAATAARRDLASGKSQET